MRVFSALMTVTVLLGGCVSLSLPVEAVRPITYHDVSYYDAHRIDRDQAAEWCRRNPGLVPRVPSCDSAFEARRLERNRQLLGLN